MRALGHLREIILRESLETPRTVVTADLRAILSCAEAWLELFPTEDLEPVERESLALVLKAVKEVQR